MSGRDATGMPPPASPAFLLMSLGRLVRDEVEQVLRADGLALRHLSALGHLAAEPGLSYSELARRAGVTAQSMQATLRQLEDRRAVERRTDPGRGRTARLHVTATGEQLLAAGRGAIAAADGRILADVPAPLHQAMTDALLGAFLAAQRRAGSSRSAPTPGRGDTSPDISAIRTER